MSSKKPELHPYIIINPNSPANDPKNGDNPEADTLARRSLDPKFNKRTGEKEKKKVAEERLGMISSIRHIAKTQLINEAKMSVDSFKDLLTTFVDFVVEKIELESSPKIILKATEDFSQQAITFGTFNMKSEETTVSITNRHPMDVLRSVAHELVHHKQKEDGRLEEDSGETGSDIENEANAVAGIIMREFGKANPHLFESGSITKLFGGKSGIRKLFDPKSIKDHRKNSKNKQALATTGGNDSEYSDSVDEEVLNEAPKAVKVVTHKGASYTKEFGSPEEYAEWIAKARSKPGKKIIKLAEQYSLISKSDASGIPYDVLEEVFSRGIYDWIESEIDSHSPSQYAFNRVNSFLAGGRASQLDEDLIVERGLSGLFGRKKKTSAEQKYRDEWLTKEKKRELAKKWRAERKQKSDAKAKRERDINTHKFSYKRWSDSANATVDKTINVGNKTVNRKQFYKDQANYHADKLNKYGVKAKRLDEHVHQVIEDIMRPSVVTRPKPPKNELKMYKNDPRDKKPNDQLRKNIQEKIEQIRRRK